MAIKGKSVIELYNPNTRIKKRYEDENIVTNAFKYLFGQNYFAQANQTFINKFLPFFKKGIGGIILFDSQIEENPDILIAPNTVGCTGYASTDAYSGSDLSRGGMNSNETELIDNGMKFVWDFATSQANGDIACISLTSESGGKVGYGSKNYCDSDVFTMSWFLNNNTNIKVKTNNVMCVVDDILYVATPLSANSIKLEKYKLFGQELGLLNYCNNPKLIEEKEITITNAISASSSRLIADKDKVYLVSKSTNTIVIDVTDFENVKEYSLPVNAYNNNTIVVMDEVVYIATETKKIELYSLVDTSAKLNEIVTNNNIVFLSNINGYICSLNEMIDKNNNIRYISNSTQINTDLLRCGKTDNDIFIQTAYTSSNYSTNGIGILSNYLATINNLQTPITKTSAQTMKITYTLTEE